MEPMTPIDPRVEMFQKGQPTDSFFNMKALAPRPMSEATEMFDTDIEDDESEIEDNSPRLSLNSVSHNSSPPPRTLLTSEPRLAEEVRRHYHPLKKYTPLVRPRMSFMASISN
jgi:hypothetical protein